MAKEEIQDLVVKISTDSTGFQSGISDINRQMAIAKQEFRLASTQLGEFSNSKEQLGLKAKSLATQIDLQSQKVQALSRTYEESRQKSGENTKATDDLKIKLLQAQRQESELNNQLKQVNEELKNQNRAFGSAGSGASEFGNIIKNAFSVTLGMGFFDMIKTGFNYAKGEAFGFNSSLQQTTIAFTTLMGSAEQANEYIQWMMDYSSKTPFEFKDLAEGSRLLMAFGFEASQIPPMLEAIGNTASGLGMKGSEGLNRIGLQLGQMNTLGKATYQDLKQLAQAGVPVWDILAEAIGKSTGEVQELVSKGLLPASETIDVLIAGMNQRFDGMMENQSKSWQGLSSSIKDNISIALGTLTQGAFQEASGMLEYISISLQNFNAIAKDQGMRAALETMIPPVLLDGLGLMKDGFTWLIEHGTVVKATIIGIGTAYTTIKLAKLLSDTERLITLKTKLGNVFTVANAKTLLIGASIALLAGGAYILYRNWENVAPWFEAMWNHIGAIFKTADDAIGVVLAGMQVGLAEFLKFTLGNTTKMVSGMLDVFSHIPKIGEEFQKAKTGVDKLGNGLDNFAKNSRTKLSEATSQYKSSFNSIRTTNEAIESAQKKMINSIGEDLSGLVQKTKESFNSLGDTSNFDTATISMEEAGANLVDAIGKGAEKKKKATKQKLEKIASEMNTAIILMDAEIKRLLADDSSLEVQQANIQRAMELTIDKIKILEAEFTRLSKAKNVNKDALNQLTKEIEGAKLAYDDLGKKLVDISEKIRQEEIKIVNEAVNQIKEALKRRYEEERKMKEDALNQELKDLDKWRDESIKRINDVYDTKIKSIEAAEKARQKSEQDSKELSRITEIKARLKELNTITIKDLETEEDKVEQIYNKRIKLIEEASNVKIKAINDEIAAIDKLLNDEEKADKDAEELKKINKLKESIEFEKNEFNKAEMKKELDRLVAEREKRLRREQLAEKKDDLKSQIDIIKSEADEKIKQLEEERQNQIEQIKFQEKINQERIRLQDELDRIIKTREERAHQESIELQIQKLKDKQKNEIDNINFIYEAHKQDLQQKLEDIKVFYKTRLEDANLQAEAEYMIMQNNQEEIVELLYSYTDHYKVAGQTLGDKLVEGFRPAIDNIKSMISEVTEQINNARSEALTLLSQPNNKKSNATQSGTSGKTVVNNFNTSIVSPVAQTPSQQYKEVERNQRNMIFQAGLA